MSNPKALLKSAKAAIDSKNWNDAVSNAQQVVEQDKNNYFAYLFLGRAKQQKNEPGESEQSYVTATRIKPEDPQAWLGLRDLYEGQGAVKVSEHTNVGVKLAEIFGKADDMHRGQVAVDKAVDFARKHGTQAQYFEALQMQLPTSSIYPYLEGRLPHPSKVYLRLAEISEKEEEERIAKAISERRTRIGARVTQVTADVKREVYSGSSLEHIYEQIIDWTNEDDVRRLYEEKLFERAYATLAVLPMAEKDAKRQQVVKLAHGMVVIKHPLLLAWMVELEWTDAVELEDVDVATIHQFVQFFPEEGLAKVLKGFLSSELSPWPASPASAKEEDADEPGNAEIAAEERLILMTEGIENASDSYLAHRLMSDYYAHLEEYELAVQLSRKGLKLLAAITTTSGLPVQANVDAIRSILATSLIYYQAPRNHHEAKTIFESILSQKGTFTLALIGIGLILEEDEDYTQAADFLRRALGRDPTNFRVGAEAAWCKAMSGDLQSGLDDLQRYLKGMIVNDTRSRDLKAQTLYRIGQCRWNIDQSRSSRKDRKQGPYVDFLAAIRTNPNCAPAYASLGIFYEDYAKDRKRARQCFQKAFELSTAQTAAAERLARSFADSGDWEVVEIIAQRVVSSGRAKPAPGSKKKGFSWPFSALGVVQMNRLDYQKAIVSFLAALRISPDDYHSYVGLGESYHNSGPYNSALRAFTYAESPPEGITLKETGETWFTRYMLANVHRELGDFEEAVEGYRAVLSSRPEEFGVSIALLQTLVERAIRSVQSGFLGLATESANEALTVARQIAKFKPDAFNLWKAVGDACAIFSWVQRRARDFPTATVVELLSLESDFTKYDVLAQVDGLDKQAVEATMSIANGDEQKEFDSVKVAIVSGLLAHKRAISSCANDIHAQAVSWYNLGWTEYRAHLCLQQPESGNSEPKAERKYLQASMRAFKRAIELEAGNAEFWNALGVVTTTKSPKIAQHAFVRSLHLNELNPQVWTNLGTLYLLENDFELAHQAFVRAQSTDPDYAPAWVGEGILAILWGNVKEAALHFAHASEISGADSFVVKKLFASSTFDKLVKSRKTIDAEDLVRPLHAMAQLHAQEITGGIAPYEHLLSLLQERTGNFEDAAMNLAALADRAERDYEQTESQTAMFQYASVKSDLARNMLASGDFAGAAEASELALDLTAADIVGVSTDHLTKVRLSAHLTNGLADYYQNDMDGAVAAFRSALEESSSNPDVICLLAQVLWARGSERERGVAREQLFEAIEANTGHVGAVCLLGVVGVLDSDVDVCEAAKDELQILRTAEGITQKQRADIETVLGATIAVLAAAEEAAAAAAATAEHESFAIKAVELNEVQSSIMLDPSHPHPWVRLADLAPEETAPGQMALEQAMRSVPPRGNLDEGELASVLAGSGSIADAQRAIFVAPWKVAGWEALRDGAEAAVRSTG